MNRVVNEMLDDLAKQASFGEIVLRRDLDPALPRITANGHRIHQLLAQIPMKSSLMKMRRSRLRSLYLPILGRM